MLWNGLGGRESQDSAELFAASEKLSRKEGTGTKQRISRWSCCVCVVCELRKRGVRGAQSMRSSLAKGITRRSASTLRREMWELAVLLLLEMGTYRSKVAVRARKRWYKEV